MRRGTNRKASKRRTVKKSDLYIAPLLLQLIAVYLKPVRNAYILSKTLGFEWGLFWYNDKLMVKRLDKTAGQSIERVLTMAKIQGLCIGVAVCNRYLLEMHFLSFLLRGFFWIIFFMLFFRAIRRLLYSYWMFHFLLILYVLLRFFGSGGLFFSEIFIFLLVIGLSVWQVCIMVRPTYYPRINWWEYDFRYRGDTKARMGVKDKFHDIRINDIRRGEASIYSFCELSPGEKIVVDRIDGMDGDFSLDFDVVTVRANVVGRPDIVGLRLSDMHDNFNYNKLKDNVHSKKISVKRFVHYE